MAEGVKYWTFWQNIIMTEWIYCNWWYELLNRIQTEHSRSLIEIVMISKHLNEEDEKLSLIFFGRLFQFKMRYCKKILIFVKSLLFIHICAIFSVWLVQRNIKETEKECFQSIINYLRTQILCHFPFGTRLLAFSS